MSTRRKFYGAWAVFAAALVLTVLLTAFAPPVLAQYVLPVTAPVLIVAAGYAGFFVRCPRCAQLLSEELVSLRIPWDYCRQCGQDLTEGETQATAS